MSNAEDSINYDNKNISNRRNVSQKRRTRFISSIEANQDLQLIVKNMAMVLGINQKDVISKAILELSIKIHKEFPDMQKYIMSLNESRSLIELQIKSKKLSEQDIKDIRKATVDFMKLASQYSPDEFLKLRDYLIKRTTSIKDRYIYDESKFEKDPW